jgi:hypothetical protein
MKKSKKGISWTYSERVNVGLVTWKPAKLSGKKQHGNH